MTLVNLTHLLVVVKLQKSKLEISPKTSTQPTTPNPNIIHSISLNMNNQGSPSPQSAHAYTMTLLFNALEDGTFVQQTVASNNDLIQPAVPVEIGNEEELRHRRIGLISGVHGRNEKRSNNNNNSSSGKNGNSVKAKPMTTTSSSISSSQMNKKKVTTAASFFGTSTKKSVDDKVKQNSDTKTTTGTKAATSRSKSSSNSTASRKVTKGNANDFVGDEDEDEDFLQEEKERKERNALRDKMAKHRSKNQDIVISNDVESMNVDDEEEEVKKEKDASEDEEMDVKTGAMDAFTKKKELNEQAGSVQKGRKRRKQVLEEKTYVDEKGFFRSEMVSVWKDVEEDEEEDGHSSQQSKSIGGNKNVQQSSQPTKKPQVKNVKGMKQQGLMGFFAAKKK